MKNEKFKIKNAVSSGVCFAFLILNF